MTKCHESLRQKDSYGTHLWRMLLAATKEESRKGKLSGSRTEISLVKGESLSFFHGQNSKPAQDRLWQ